MKRLNKFKKVAVLDTVIFYPEHRAVLNRVAEEVLEFPSSLPEGLEKQYTEQPELFLDKKCYTQIATNDIPLQLLMNRVDGADVIISCWTDIPDEILKLNPQLKLIIFWTHEKEHRVNLQLAEELGIKVINVPDYGTDAVKEVVFAGLFELIKRNNPPSKSQEKTNLETAILEATFNHFRMLLNIEKNTRQGKFGHHFHKLGMVKFDFDRKQLADLIPERLINMKRIGFLNVTNQNRAIEYLKSFGANVEIYFTSDTSLAEYYKFLAEQEIIFFDSNLLPDKELEKLEILFADKLIDINKLSDIEYDLKGKIFGIVGMGRIGKQVAITAKNLGFEVVYFSKNRKIDLENEFGFKYMDIEELASTSDVISIHLPAHKAENLFNSSLIAKIKKGAMFINTADGNAIDQAALTERLVRGEIYAYLDVYPGLPRKDVLGLDMADKADWKIKNILPNNVFAYRAGWKTQESICVKTYKLLGEMIKILIQ